MTLPSPQTPDELANIESKAAEVTGLVGMVAGAASIFSAFRKPKNPPVAQTPPSAPASDQPMNTSSNNSTGGEVL